MEREKLPRQVLINWILSYSLVLLIPLAGFSLCNLQWKQTLRRATAEANQQILHSISMTFDEKIGDLYAAQNFVLYNTNLSKLKNAANLPDHHVEINALLQEIGAYALSLGTRINFLMYFEPQDYIITGNTATQSMSVYYMLGNADKGAYDAWKELLRTAPTDTLMVSDQFGFRADGPALVHCVSLPRTANRLRLFVSIPLADFAVSADIPEQSHLLLARESGELLYSFFEASPVDAQSQDTFQAKSAFIGKDQKHYVGICQLAKQGRLSYQLFTSEERYWAALRDSQLQYYAFWGVTLILGIALEIIFLQRNYLPLQKILHKLPATIAGTRNEFSLIEKSIQSVSSENEGLKEMVLRQNGRLRSHTLLAYLQTGVTPSQPEETLLLSEMQDKQFWLLMLQLFPAAQTEKNDAKYANVRYSIRQLAAQILKAYSFVILEEEPLVCLFYGTHADAAAWRSEQEALLADLQDQARQGWNAVFALIHTPASASFVELPEQYHEAREALELMLLSNRPGVVSLSAVERQADNLNEMKEAQRAALTNALRKGDATACDQIVAELFSTPILLSGPSFAARRLALIEMVCPLLEIYFDSVPDADAKRQLVSKMNQLLTAETPEQLRSLLCDLLRFACQTLNGQFQNSRDIVASAKNYIALHYTDCNLSVSEIAQALGNNAKYISHVFSVQTGTLLSDYINAVRVGHACRILCTRPDTVENVSLLSGFNNVRTFRRVFAKITGMSPSQYRAMHDVEP